MSYVCLIVKGGVILMTRVEYVQSSRVISDRIYRDINNNATVHLPFVRPSVMRAILECCEFRVEQKDLPNAERHIWHRGFLRRNWGLKYDFRRTAEVLDLPELSGLFSIRLTKILED